MGIEYRIRFQPRHVELDRQLRALRCFMRFDPQDRLYFLNVGAVVSTEMPNAWVAIEPDGLYLCDNGGTPTDRAMIFRSVINVALDQSTSIEIEQL